MGHDDTLANAIRIPVSPGELIDKITILRIKAERATAPAALANVRTELGGLEAVAAGALPESADLRRLTDQLRAVNEILWDVEDEIRRCDRAGDFGPRFVELARTVYARNDERARLKRAINDLLGSPLVEEKVFSGDP